MCGRYVTKAEAEIERFWGIRRTTGTGFPARYNAAPTQSLPVIIAQPGGERDLRLLRWGLVPSWARDPGIGLRMINARAETVADKPAFREAFRRRRCLVPMAGYYEWRPTATGKMPHYFHLLNAGQFAVAGIHEHWAGHNGEAPLDSYAIITTRANEMAATVHDRMPAILPEDAHAEWLDPAIQEKESLLRLLEPFSAEEMRCYRVGSRVNNASNDGPELAQPAP